MKSITEIRKEGIEGRLVRLGAYFNLGIRQDYKTYHPIATSNQTIQSEKRENGTIKFICFYSQELIEFT